MFFEKGELGTEEGNLFSNYIHSLQCMFPYSFNMHSLTISFLADIEKLNISWVSIQCITISYSQNENSARSSACVSINYFFAYKNEH